MREMWSVIGNSLALEGAVEACPAAPRALNECRSDYAETYSDDDLP
jgi:hypothetical protein